MGMLKFIKPEEDYLLYKDMSPTGTNLIMEIEGGFEQRDPVHARKL
jgi:hypothetical protein